MSLATLDRHIKFQSTSPVRGTTLISACAFSPIFISIHVPREGDDIGRPLISARFSYFNPRPP